MVRAFRAGTAPPAVPSSADRPSVHRRARTMGSWRRRISCAASTRPIGATRGWRSRPRLFGALFACSAGARNTRPGCFLRCWLRSRGRQAPAERRTLRPPPRASSEAFRQGNRSAAYESFLQFRPLRVSASPRWPCLPISGWVIVTPSLPRAMGEPTCSARFRVDLRWAHGGGHFNIEDWDCDPLLRVCPGHRQAPRQLAFAG